MKRTTLLVRCAILAALCAGNILLWGYFVHLRGLSAFSVVYFDVGQGDAALVRAPGSLQALVDGGPSRDVLAKVHSAMPLFDRLIELVVITHYDNDHLRGILPVLERYEVGRVVGLAEADDSAEYAELQKILAQKNIPFSGIGNGMRARFSEKMFFDIFAPQKTGQEKNHSLFIKVVYGATAYLFTGDAEEAEEKEAIAEGFDLNADVLKVGHHGSKYSTSAEFLNTVGPLFSVISVGAGNRYGHPNGELLQRLAGIDILRTDILGNINIFSDGSNVYKIE
jgi:competence protein ComEC